MRAGVAKRVSQYKPPGDYGFESGYKAGWDAAIQWMKGQQMPVPQGEITTTETMSNLNPKEVADAEQVQSDGDGESGVPDGDAPSKL